MIVPEARIAVLRSEVQLAFDRAVKDACAKIKHNPMTRNMRELFVSSCCARYGYIEGSLTFSVYSQVFCLAEGELRTCE